MHNDGLKINRGGQDVWLRESLREAAAADDASEAFRFHGQTFVPGDEESLAARFKDKGTTGRKKKKYAGEISATQERIGSIDSVIFPSLEEVKQENRDMLVSLRYRDRCFEKPAESPFYMYPKLSTPNSELDESLKKLKKPKRFVMASCLFGSSMRGLTEEGLEIPLIDHHLKLPSKITDIKVDAYPHPYEIMTFSSVKSLFGTMKAIGDDDFEVRYHLPVVDYMLYGVRLFLRNEMTPEALEKYIKQVRMRGDYHKHIIETLAGESGINIQIESPFDNLFGREDLSIRDFMVLFGGLKGSEGSKVEEIVLEKQFAQRSVRFLKDNHYVEAHGAAWQKIFSHISTDSIGSLDDLFRLANAAEVAFACSEEGVEDFEVCSLLPADEEPIFNSYVRHLREHFKEVTALLWLPRVWNCTTPEKGQEDSHESYNLFRLRPDRMDPDPFLTRKICGAALPNKGDQQRFVNLMKEAVVRLGEKIVPGAKQPSAFVRSGANELGRNDLVFPRAQGTLFFKQSDGDSKNTSSGLDLKLGLIPQKV